MIRIKDLTVNLSEFRLEINDLRVEKGEYLVLLGPSGVGKTVLIQTISGIIKPDNGKIIINDRDVTRLPPERRGVAIVPQDYALWPHMTVLENIIYGLRLRGIPPNDSIRRARELASLLGISRILDKKPGKLSGGEQQRVALARALIVEPEILLLDEPLASLDPETRIKGRKLIRKLHEKIGFTAIHVTHSIIDALTLANKISYMKEGKLLCTCNVGEFLEQEYSKPYIDEIKNTIDKIIS